MVDHAKLDRLLSNLSRYVATLRELGGSSRQEFLQQADKIGNAKYHFIIAIECCIDAANYIIASEGYRRAKDGADSFRVLVENRIIPDDKLDALCAMSKFRNRLVHVYWDVDDERVHEYMLSCLGDFDEFAKAVASHFDVAR